MPLKVNVLSKYIFKHADNVLLMSATITSLTLSKAIQVATANLPIPPLPPRANTFTNLFYVLMMSNILIDGAASQRAVTASKVPSSVLN